MRWSAGAHGGAQTVAANADVAFLVTSLNADFSLRRLGRYLATAYESGTRPVIMLTKADLYEQVGELLAQAQATALDAPVLAISAKTGQGL